MSPWLCFIAGLCVGAATGVGAIPLWRAARRMAVRLPLAAPMVLGGIAVFATAASVLYVGIDGRPTVSAAHGAIAPAAVAPTSAEPAAAAPTVDTAAPAQPTESANPVDAKGWLELAAKKRRDHDYAGARQAFSQVIRLNAMTADSWADYADATASMSGGSLGGEAELAIQRALSLDPRHPKALWLEASHAYEERRYSDALTLWKRLRATLRADSPDAGLVDANIAESAQLALSPKG